MTLHLSLALADGTVAESTFDSEPLTFVMGDGTLDHGLELGIYGLVSGDRQQLTLEPGQAFGERDPANIHAVPRSAFADDIPLEPGTIIGFEAPDGAELAGAVLEIDAEHVKVDFNHPLAGRRIVFDVEILEVVPAASAE